MLSIYCQLCRHYASAVFRSIGIFIILGGLLGLMGCGEEDLEPQYYNPSAPLPLRVDAKTTPKPPETLPEWIETVETPAPEAEEKTTNEAVEPTPTPTATLTPTPTATATATPMPSPEPTPVPEKKTSSPPPTPVVITPEPEPITNPNVSTKAEEEKEAQQQVKKSGPIVTPYGITIDKLATCSTVANRNPSGCSDTFSLAETGKVFTWMRVSGVSPPRVIKHTYYWEGKLVASVSLKLKYTSMRTWSQKTFKPDHTGKWKVVLTTDKAGEVLAVREWTVTP